MLVVGVAAFAVSCSAPKTEAASSATRAASTATTPPVVQTSPSINALTGKLPPEVRRRILAAPEQFLSLLKEVLAEPGAFVMLVDKKHALPAGYAPEDLVRLRDYDLSLNRKDLELRRVVMADLLKMVHAAREQQVEPVLSSTYRSYSYQKEVFAREVAQYGVAQAERESARPGTSQHQLGTAIDFGSITEAFAATAAGRWLDAHAWEYGFSMSYPKGHEALTGYKYEPWHFRYIGRSAAKMQHDYFGVQQLLLVFLHDNRAALERIAGR